MGENATLCGGLAGALRTTLGRRQVLKKCSDSEDALTMTENAFGIYGVDS